jgi:hypothetical protein
MQAPMPEVESVPLALTVSAWLYQPFRSGLRDGAVVTCGGVAS